MKRTPLKRKTPLKRGFSQLKRVECRDSPSGRHVFSQDLEYDSSGKTWNCEHCGMPRPTRTKLKARSKKKEKQDREYTKLRKEFLRKHPYCKVCQDLGISSGIVTIHTIGMVNVIPLSFAATEVHHMGRRGKNYLDTSTWLPTCRAHHDFIEKHGDWARQHGYLLTPEQKRKL